MKHKLFAVLALLLCAGLVSAQEPIYDYFTYLPVVIGGSGGTATPTVSPTVPPPLTATPVPTGTVTPTPTATPTPMVTSTPDPRGVFALPNAIAYQGSSYHGGEWCHVVGEVQNDTLGYVKNIGFDIYVNQGGTLLLGYSDVMEWTIPPGGKACLNPWDPEMGSCLGGPPDVVIEVTSYEVGDSDRVHDIAFDDFTASRCWFGEVLRANFRVNNNGALPIKNIAYRGTLYDGSGGLLGCRRNSTHPSSWFNLGVGDSAYKTAYYSALHYAGGPISFQFVANGDPDLNPTATLTPTPGITVVPGGD